MEGGGAPRGLRCAMCPSTHLRKGGAPRGGANQRNRLQTTPHTTPLARRPPPPSPLMTGQALPGPAVAGLPMGPQPLAVAPLVTPRAHPHDSRADAWGGGGGGGAEDMGGGGAQEALWRRGCGAMGGGGAEPHPAAPHGAGRRSTTAPRGGGEDRTPPPLNIEGGVGGLKRAHGAHTK